MLQRGMRTPQLGTLVPRINCVWCVGGWIPVLPTKNGHYYSSKFYVLA